MKRSEFLLAIFSLIMFSACRFDPTEKEIISHVPVSFSLDPLTSYSPADFSLYDQLIESDEGAGSLRIFPENPSSTNFLDVAATSFRVRSANGAEYTFALTGNQIQRQSDRIILNIPNMPVGPGTLGGVLFMTNGGTANGADETPATGTRDFTGVWVTAGAGGDVPIDVSSSSLSTQVISVPLMDATQGNNGPHLARSDVSVELCKGAGMADTPAGAYAQVGNGSNCGATVGGNAITLNTSTYLRFNIAGVWSGWTAISTPLPLKYLMFGAQTPRVSLQAYCTGSCGGAFGTAGTFYTGCPFSVSSNILDAYNYGASDTLYLWFKQCS